MNTTIAKTKAAIDALQTQLAGQAETTAKEILSGALSALTDDQQTLLIGYATDVLMDAPLQELSSETLIEESLAAMSEGDDLWQARLIRALLNGDIETAHRLRRWIRLGDIAEEYQISFGPQSPLLELLTNPMKGEQTPVKQFVYVDESTDGSNDVTVTGSPAEAVNALTQGIASGYIPVAVIDLDTGRRASATIRVELSAFEKQQ